MTEFKVLTSGSITHRWLLEVCFLLIFLPYIHPAAHTSVSFIYSKLILKKSMLCFNTRESHDDFIINKGKSELDSSSKLVTTES